MGLGVQLLILEAGRSKMKEPVDLGSGEGLLSGLQLAAFSLCLHREAPLGHKHLCLFL